eukprot:scaffold277472_cov36-Prasinocladus_malaysianus.AAC.2
MGGSEWPEGELVRAVPEPQNWRERELICGWILSRWPLRHLDCNYSPDQITVLLLSNEVL